MPGSCTQSGWRWSRRITQSPPSRAGARENSCFTVTVSPIWTRLRRGDASTGTRHGSAVLGLAFCLRLVGGDCPGRSPAVPGSRQPVRDPTELVDPAALKVRTVIFTAVAAVREATLCRRGRDAERAAGAAVRRARLRHRLTKAPGATTPGRRRSAGAAPGAACSERGRRRRALPIPDTLPRHSITAQLSPSCAPDRVPGEAAVGSTNGAPRSRPRCFGWRSPSCSSIACSHCRCVTAEAGPHRKRDPPAPDEAGGSD
jgi:hypothetical protein